MPKGIARSLVILIIAVIIITVFGLGSSSYGSFLPCPLYIGNCYNDFSLNLSPPSGAVAQDRSILSVVTVNWIYKTASGYEKTVYLSIPSCPEGATCSLDPTSCIPLPACISILTIKTTSSLSQGSNDVYIQGTDGINTHTAMFSIINPI